MKWKGHPVAGDGEERGDLMGSIRGDLSVLGIANLLQSLSLNPSEGFLILEGATHEKTFYLHDRKVRLVHGSRRCARLEKFLRRVGPITSHSPAGRDALRHILHEWLIEEMGEVFGWLRAGFQFHEGPEAPKGILALPAAAMADGEMEVMSVILDSARRTDDIPRIRALIPDLEIVPEQNPQAEITEEMFDPEVLKDVYPLVDGHRSAREIVNTSAFPRHSVLQVLYRLRLQGAILVRTCGVRPPEAVPEMA
jgi:hypothetical protein